MSNFPVFTRDASLRMRQRKTLRDSTVYMYMVLEFLPHLFGEEVEVPTMQSGQQPSNEAVLKELHWGWVVHFGYATSFLLFILFQSSIT